MLQFRKCIREFCTILITVWILVTLPITIILVLPFYILRWTVSNLSRYFRPDLAQMVSAVSSLLAADTVYSCPRINIGVNLKLDTLNRKTTKGEIVQIFQSSWIAARNAQGKLLYPEFQQYLTSWMGYSFWKWELDFEIENHVYSIEGNAVRPDQYLNPSLYRRPESMGTNYIWNTRWGWFKVNSMLKFLLYLGMIAIAIMRKTW